MADTVTTSNEIVYTLEFAGPDNTTASRTLSIPDAKDYVEYRQDILDIRDSILGGYSTFFQPATWEDSDDPTEEYTVSACTVMNIQTTKIILDDTRETLTGWGILSNNNFTVAPEGEATLTIQLREGSSTGSTITTIANDTITPSFTNGGSLEMFFDNNSHQYNVTIKAGTNSTNMTFSEFRVISGGNIYDVEFDESAMPIKIMIAVD